MEVAIGVDSHKSSLAAAAVDPLGRVIGAEEFPNSPEGHEALLGWVRRHDPDRRIGIECSLSYGAAATRFLLAHREDVREVPSSLTARQRRLRRSQGEVRSHRLGGDRPGGGRRRRSSLRRAGGPSFGPEAPRRLP